MSSVVRIPRIIAHHASDVNELGNERVLSVGPQGCIGNSQTPMLRRRIWINVLLTVAALALGYAFVHFFLAQLGRDERPGLAAVVAAPPPGFEIVDLGSMAPARAARELSSLLAARPRRVGIRFSTPRATLYWLADPASDSLEERSAGATGTRLATIWNGQLRRRLDWAAAHDGDLSPPDLAPPERTNLYH
jgi:hypothetical protein